MGLLLGQQVGRELIKILGLPKKTVSFEIRFAYDEVVTVRCEFYPDVPDSVDLATVFSTYRIESRPEPKPKFQLSARFGGSAEVRDDFNAWLLEQFGYEEAAA